MTRPSGPWLLALLAACSPRPPAPPAGSPAPEPSVRPAASTVITLERTPCYGACPVYSLSISGEGQVHFTGVRHTAHIGQATAAIPPARVDSLVAELRAGGYFGFAEAYVHGAPACGRYSTDSPSVITSVEAEGERKLVRHDYGCPEAPAELARLERRIDEVAGSARWTGR